MLDYFEAIQNEMEAAYPGVAAGKMMRSPAITYRSKVFAFFHQNEMVFKLYLDQYVGARFLQPFKYKKPMKGWLIVPGDFNHDWASLAICAYQNLSEK